MGSLSPPLPRLRQAVLVAEDLDRVAARLRNELALARPFSDPSVAHFGLRNAVFALEDTFLEVVSPTRADASAARLLARRGGDCGYMVMVQVGDFASARGRARSRGVREVFEVSLPDMVEVHLHPGDMRAAIVSISSPTPVESWRWGGPDWEARRSRGRLTGVVIEAREPEVVREQWTAVLGDHAGITFRRNDYDRGLVEIAIAVEEARSPVEIGGVRFTFVPREDPE